MPNETSEPGVSELLSGATLTSPPADPAVYERPAFAAAVLLAWIVLAVGLARWRFRATDL